MITQKTGNSRPLDCRTIRLDRVSKHWGSNHALKDVSVDIEANKFTALLGPSGCGKSTALRLISGLEEASSGRIKIGDQDVTRKPASARDIAMVFQSYALFPHLSVAENIIFGLRVRRLSRAERDNKLTTAAEMLGLTPFLGRKPNQLSGGQQQRVALARAIVADKSIFLMDEPLSNLDAKLRAEMREEIRELQQRLGVTMLYVTHDQIEAVTMADQIILMKDGQIEQIAPPRQIYSMPETLFAAGFIGTPPMNTFSGAVFTSDAQCRNRETVFGIRPEALKIAGKGPINGTVRRIEYLGADAIIDCQIGEQSLLCRGPSEMTVVEGASIALSFDPESLHAFNRKTGRREHQLPVEIEKLIAAHHNV